MNNYYIPEKNITKATIAATKHVFTSVAGWKKDKELGYIEYDFEKAIKSVLDKHNIKYGGLK